MAAGGMPRRPFWAASRPPLLLRRGLPPALRHRRALRLAGPFLGGTRPTAWWLALALVPAPLPLGSWPSLTHCAAPSLLRHPDWRVLQRERLSRSRPARPVGPRRSLLPVPVAVPLPLGPEPRYDSSFLCLRSSGPRAPLVSPTMARSFRTAAPGSGMHTGAHGLGTLRIASHCRGDPPRPCQQRLSLGLS